MKEKKYIKIDIPDNVSLIIKELEKKGFEAFAVGGCVRDAILKKKPNDWDITTSASPMDIKSVFLRTIDTGIEHGTVTVLIGKESYEVTTYRIDGDYIDGRHPESVLFTDNLKKDLERRDFTINAMAYNKKTGLVDEFDGINDLEKKVIRCVGNPYDRFNEDALRMLRAIRFSAVLGFEIENETNSAIKDLCDNLEKVSKERIQVEMDKLLISDNPGRIENLVNTGISKYCLKELDRLNDNQELESVKCFVESLPKNHYYRWAGVLIRFDDEEVKKSLRSLKWDNKTIDIVSRLVRSINYPEMKSRADVRKGIFELGNDIFPLYIEFKSYYDAWMGVQGNMDFVKKEYDDIISKKECVSLKELDITGRDLIDNFGISGSDIGDGLKSLLYMVLEDTDLNKKEKLIELYKSIHSF
ncbi:tRNA nucleotidyltransferase (CCA-adding enzyme) [Lachnospiraceae bacterium RM5]|nr:tRNA nucleotidyltransferase (CCA-adding enzyme) [Lachnospiraceae bacterium RM5]